MRFGKKLALQVMDDASGAPYVSHKAMKEAISRAVRELRLYQARLQQTDLGWKDDGTSCSTTDMRLPTPAELSEMEARVTAFDEELFAIVDDDLFRILAHAQDCETLFSARLARLQGGLVRAGLLMEEAQLQRLETLMPAAQGDKPSLCQRVLEFRICAAPVDAFRAQQSLAVEYNAAVEVANQHAQYLELNVAGFRKLLKRHEKQIPQPFRSRPGPFLGFHRLVSHRCRSMLDFLRQVKSVLALAREIFEQALPSADAAPDVDMEWVELEELRGLGPECETVLSIRRQLREHTGGVPRQVVSSMYPKPGVDNPPAMSGS
eukprot:CAMPEP_0176156214 /NCGR_PEP_ID=MMETSP0120_2-20121206/79845_1 /TAXON_ID=160619 /ORGANISM="Kryptoperidinium foliaceum, Strain CCMP 1326" /LENGTH=319 /DNA_ID=CAMNT_0017493423 /DNA_START=14 /DNA_END=973 /DNA_ORIENTATION=-